MFNNFELLPNRLESYDISPLSEEFTRVTLTAEDGEYNALKDVGAYTYNGVNLPPPPVYDTAAYPFAMVYRDSAGRPCYAYGSAANAGEYYRCVYYEDACEDASTFAWGAATKIENLTVDSADLIWVNTTTDAMYRSRAEKATFKRYRFNGTLAPELPDDWDRERYPYGTILADSSGIMFELDVTNVPGVINVGSSGSIVLKFSGTNIRHSGWVASPDQIKAAKWEDLNVGTLASSQKWTQYVENQSRNDGWSLGGVLFWTNYDLKTEDGTVVLKASEPELEWLDLPYGRTLKVEVPWGTQRNADILLSTISDYRYQPFTASKVYLDPAAELGDGITVGGVNAVLCSQDLSFGVLCSSDISAPEDEELDHEYTFKTKQERTAARQSAAIRKTEGVTSGRETAERLKTQEFYVGGQKYAPMTITYTDGNGNPGTMTVLGLVP